LEYQMDTIYISRIFSDLSALQKIIEEAFDISIFLFY
jgi:hypothetical protein